MCNKFDKTFGVITREIIIKRSKFRKVVRKDSPKTSQGIRGKVKSLHKKKPSNLKKSYRPWLCITEVNFPILKTLKGNSITFFRHNFFFQLCNSMSTWLFTKYKFSDEFIYFYSTDNIFRRVKIILGSKDLPKNHVYTG